MLSYIAGLDEAGRGSVIGPLVVCIAYCSRNDEKRLKQLGKKDSKQLSAKQRSEIYEQLKQFCTFKWTEVSAADINKMMAEMNLNDIEAKTMANLIKHVDADVMIDLPDRYAYTFQKRMETFGIKKFEAQHKADENYPIVAAASICAKLMRDKKIDEISAEIGEFGSGYPSDPDTIKALRDKDMRIKLKPFIRERWQTLENIKQRKLSDYEE